MGNSETVFSRYDVAVKDELTRQNSDPPCPPGEASRGSSRHFTGTSPEPNAADHERLRDEALFAKVCQGDREALAVLFRHYARIVRTVAQRILHNGSEADDLVQEVFLFVFRRGALFDPSRGSVRSWLIQVAWHRAIDRRRHLASRHFYDSVQLEDQMEFREAPAFNFYEESVEGALGRDTLRKIDAALSEDQRRVVRLYFFEGHTIQEIAVLLNQTPGNVRNHYYRALEKMRREIFLTKLLKK